MVTVDETAPEGAAGRRVAVQRKLAGMTQQQLADRAHVSRSLISQVEQGALPASGAFLAAVARVLGVDVDALTGQPYGTPITSPRAEHAGIPALRAALDNDDDPEFEGSPMPADEVRIRLDDCQSCCDNARYATVTAALPGLLNHSYALVHQAGSGSAAELAWGLLADGYELAQVVSHCFGYLDLATLAARCGRDAARRVGDPLRVAVAAVRCTELRLQRGDHPAVLRVLDHAHELIDGQHCAAAEAVRAHLHLRQALTHAHRGDPAKADEHLTIARMLVTRGVPERPYHGVFASPVTVDIHRVAVAVELCDGLTAVDRAGQVQLPDHIPPCRAGDHWITVARAWTLHGDRTKALEALHQARRAAPQLTRYHPGIHETVHRLAERDRRADDTLAGFSRWLGITLCVPGRA